MKNIFARILELKKLKIFSLCAISAGILLIAGSVNAQQSFNYTQHANNLLPINTAYSLVNPEGQVGFLGRKQWVGIKGAPTTFIANGYLPISGDSTMTAGTNIFYDQIGKEKLSQIDAFIAKGVRISEKDFLSVSMSFGVRRFVTDYASLDVNDPNLQNDIRETVGNIGLSVMAYGNVGKTENKYYAGVSIPRVGRMAFGNASTENRYFKKQYYIAGGYTQMINETFSAQPAILVSFSGNTPLQANFSGTLYVQQKFGVGFNYRTDNELAALLNMNVNERIRASYSYQFGFGATKLGGITVATHEIGFAYRFTVPNSLKPTE